MNKISVIIEFDEVSKIQEEQLTEFIEKTGIKFHVLESDNDLKKYKKYKEVIDKIQKHCEIEINASNHYLENHSSQKELCHKVAHQRILDMLKEVE